MKRNQLLLVGAGYMGREYAKVLKALNCDFTVVGRGSTLANKFTSELGIPVFQGGISKWLQSNDVCPKTAIVAVTGNELGSVVYSLIYRGVKLLLVEKPGGVDFDEIEKICKLVKKKKIEMYLGYNRRFYSSVLQAESIIENDGGTQSLIFEFTEWDNVVSEIKLPVSVKKQWFLHNSSHVVDLAFFIGGRPKKIASFSGGRMVWHPQGAIFVGAGITERKIFFSYSANWDAPGRWGLEILTKKSRLIFRPFEQLHIQKKGELEIRKLNMDDKLDTRFKPGLYLQVKAFLSDKKRLCSIQEHLENCKFYKMILSLN